MFLMWVEGGGWDLSHPTIIQEAGMVLPILEARLGGMRAFQSHPSFLLWWMFVGLASPQGGGGTAFYKAHLDDHT